MFLAALTMYQRARKLQGLITDAVSFASLAEDQLEAYSVAINSLSLVDQKNSWVLLPISPDITHEVSIFPVHVSTECLLTTASLGKKGNFHDIFLKAGILPGNLTRKWFTSRIYVATMHSCLLRSMYYGGIPHYYLPQVWLFPLLYIGVRLISFQLSRVSAASTLGHLEVGTGQSI